MIVPLRFMPDAEFCRKCGLKRVGRPRRGRPRWQELVNINRVTVVTEFGFSECWSVYCFFWDLRLFAGLIFGANLQLFGVYAIYAYGTTSTGRLNISGWWFGTWILYFPQSLGWWSNLTNSIIFPGGGWLNHHFVTARVPTLPAISPAGWSPSIVAKGPCYTPYLMGRFDGHRLMTRQMLYHTSQSIDRICHK